MSKTIEEIEAMAAALEAGKAPQKARTWWCDDSSPYRVEIEPMGGKPEAPAFAVFFLVHDQYADDGTVESTHGPRVPLRGDDDRQFYCSWVSANREKGSKRRGTIDRLITEQFKSQMDTLLPEAVRLPREVAALLDKLRACMPEAPMDVIVTTARHWDSKLAPFIADDGTYRPPLDLDVADRETLIAYAKDNGLSVKTNGKTETIRAACQKHAAK